MKITLLCENAIGYDGADTCLAEWGLSLFIQTRVNNVLFDTGRTDVYWKNAAELGIDLETTEFVILSHHHGDHAGGLRFHDFQGKKTLIAHPIVIKKFPRDVSRKIWEDFEIMTSREPFEFSENMIYLGEIPRINDFEDIGTKYKVPDDSAMVIKTPRGAVLITGCSHAGICNICEYAKKVSGQNLYAVIGGFHLFEGDSEVVERTLDYFKTEQPTYLFPMHCVDFPTLAKFHAQLGIKKYATGDVIELKTGE